MGSYHLAASIQTLMSVSEKRTYMFGWYVFILPLANRKRRTETATSSTNRFLTGAAHTAFKNLCARGTQP